MDDAGLYPPLSASGRHRAGCYRAVDRAGAARFRQSLGAGRALEGGAGRQAHGDALEALRAGGRRRVQRHGRRIQDRDRHRDERVLAKSFEDVQPKASVAANTGSGLDLAWGLHTLPQLFPTKVLQDERRCRLSRQEIRRMDRCCREDLQAGQRLARHSRRDHRRLSDLPQVGGRQGRLQANSRRISRASSNCARR